MIHLRQYLMPMRCAAALAVVTLCGAPDVRAQFVESVDVIHTFSGTGSFGWGVADLVDIDNDNVTDVIIGAPGSNVCQVYSGASGQLIHDLIPSTPGGRFGHALADAGDVDNDGVHDIIVGANTSSGSGRAFVFSGATGAEILDFLGEVSSDSFGYAVAGVGEINGDEFDDLLVGAQNHGTAGFNAGRVYLYSGVDGSLIRIIDGEAANDLFGAGTAGTGDIDGDGFGDQIVGAPGAGAGNLGKAFVYSGADGSLIFSTDSPAGGNSYGVFFVAGAGDVNNDGTRDVYVGDFGWNGGGGKAYVYSGVDGSELHVFPGSSGEGVGPGRAAGDVDGDGFNDLIVGHWTSSTGALGAGKATIRSGANGDVLRTITSTIGGENFGFDAVGVGDVNNDGKMDFLISAATQNRVYLISGAIEAPTLAPSPHDILKNRYISIDPRGAGGARGGLNFDIRVTLTSTQVSGVTAIDSEWWANEPDAKCISIVGPSRPSVPPNWGACPTLHLTGCSIIPTSIYGIVVADGALVSDPPLVAATQAKPGVKWWGDSVGQFNGVEWTPPNGATSIDDAVAAIKTFQDINAINATHLSVTDLVPAQNGSQINKVVNFDDVFAAILGFQGEEYPGPQIELCPDM